MTTTSVQAAPALHCRQPCPPRRRFSRRDNDPACWPSSETQVRRCVPLRPPPPPPRTPSPCRGTCVGHMHCGWLSKRARRKQRRAAPVLLRSLETVVAALVHRYPSDLFQASHPVIQLSGSQGCPGGVTQTATPDQSEDCIYPARVIPRSPGASSLRRSAPWPLRAKQPSAALRVSAEESVQIMAATAAAGSRAAHGALRVRAPRLRARPSVARRQRSTRSCSEQMTTSPKHRMTVRWTSPWAACAMS